MNRRRTTMADVARHAGVSLKTVSRVVNQEPHVRQDLVRRVQGAITALGFRRNEAASRLARGGSVLTLGLVIENISNEFYSSLAKAVERAASAHEALVVFGSYEERADREVMLIDTMYGRGVDAMVIVPTAGDHTWLTEYLASGLTAVFVDRVPEGLPDTDAVLLDAEAGGQLATRHLLAYGHRRIALISDNDPLSSVHARAEGYRTALRAAGAAADPALCVTGLFDPWQVEQEVLRLLALPDPPTAFFVTNNRAAIGLMQALRDHPGPRPAFVGFDDFEMAGVFTPGVTVVRYDVTRLGSAAVELLLARVRDPARPSQRVTVPVELVVRGSGEVPPP
ncbi:LacI family DNA-binding transcriptional regulator [Nonomuraea africana]|uniref:LacI family transcriptional regulator n=1 Tax=Nonomuraea africana TaxID=46171 RepID=A0ABR9KVJ2_9ACTN|nr:LacI family DNA-binding transcriptional regulator [Nonomuraea africana]MBE1566056.1 LacI family transcriptional regulator [Nonomuraea africana]